MGRLLSFLGAVVGSVVLYVAAFSVIERPLTLGDLTRQLDYKLAYAISLKSPKIVILAGSNGRYSHRCAEFSAVLALPCVNASIASGIGLDFLLDRFGAVLQRGDIVYMPLEYGQYGVTEPEMHLGAQNAVLLRHDPQYLRTLPVLRIGQTYGAFDLPFLLRGVAEMALARASFRRRTGVETLTEQGDERGHTPDKAGAYAEFIATAAPPDTHVPDSSFAETVLKRFLVAARSRGIVVVGGLPTVPSNTPIEPRSIARIRTLFESAGQRFLLSPGQSRYPRSCFYDVTYHLNEVCQGLHSHATAILLQRLLRSEVSSRVSAAFACGEEPKEEA